MEEIIRSEEVFDKIPKHQSTPKETMGRSERKSLQTLQASPNGNGLNGGKGCITEESKNSQVSNNHREKSHHQTKNLSVYEDPHVADSSSNVLCSKGTQTEKIYNMDGCSWNEGESTTSGGDSAYFDQEAFDLMANDTPPEAYWKDLAEERRRALEESLEENRRLSLEVTQLREENSRLSDVAQEAKELRELLETALSDDEDSPINTKDEQPLACEEEDSGKPATEAAQSPIQKVHFEKGTSS